VNHVFLAFRVHVIQTEKSDRSSDAMQSFVELQPDMESFVANFDIASILTEVKCVELNY